MCIILGKSDEGNCLLMRAPLKDFFWIVKLDNLNKFSQHVQNKMVDAWLSCLLVLILYVESIINIVEMC